ncbi:MAG: ABC transporter permease [Planctomycetota bacterium]
MTHFIATLARHDLRLQLAQRETLVWTFVLPAVFFWFIGTVTSSFGGGGGGSEPWIALRQDPEAGFLADELQTRLDEAGFALARPDSDGSEFAFDDYRRRLELPGGLTADLLAGEAVTLRLARREGGLGADLDGFRARRAVWGTLADLVALDAAGTEPSPEAFAELRARQRFLELEVEAAGNLEAIPTGFQQAVPGTMVMFTLVIVLTSGASTLITERRSGVLRRLAASPMPRAAVFWGKWLGKLGLALIQMAFAVLIGTLLFGVDWGPAPTGLALVLTAYAALVASLGLLLGNLARSEPQAIGIAILASNLLAALGGCWWPIEITPRWVQDLALFTPTGATMDALHALMSFGAPTSAVLGHAGALALGAVVIGVAAGRRMRLSD